MSGQAGREMTGVERLIGEEKQLGQIVVGPSVPPSNMSLVVRVNELEQAVGRLQNRIENCEQAFTELVARLIAQVGVQF